MGGKPLAGSYYMYIQFVGGLVHRHRSTHSVAADRAEEKNIDAL